VKLDMTGESLAESSNPSQLEFAPVNQSLELFSFRHDHLYLRRLSRGAACELDREGERKSAEAV
jgi:hypothetical protein